MPDRNRWKAGWSWAAVGLTLVIVSAACGLPVNAVQTPTSPVSPTLTAGPLPPSMTATPAAPLPTATTLLPTATPGKVYDAVMIYLVAVGDGGQTGPAVGCGDSLVGVRREISPTVRPLEAAVRDLLSIKTQDYGQSGLYNALWQSNLKVVSAAIDTQGTAAVALSGQVQMGGECDTPRFKGQLEQTILAIEGVKSAAIFINGRPIDEVLSLR